MRKLLLIGAVLSLAFSPSELKALDDLDIYLAGYISSSFPSDRDAQLNGKRIQGTSIGRGLGGGIKIGVFPDFTKRLVGIELEYNGHNGDVELPLTSGFGTSSKTNLIVLNSMVNLVLRCPYDRLVPYVGLGVGSSSGILSEAKISGRKNEDLETTIAFAHQVFAGLQVRIYGKIFLFGEYKYLSANYHWKQLSVDLRSQYAIGGIGFQF